jgi:enamine deaminase RidA (YjgF/YER057c/UK114 family)
MDIDRIQPGAWNSRASVFGDLVFLSGDDKSLLMKEQTAQVLAKIDAVLNEAATESRL